MEKNAPRAYCEDQVRHFDQDRYLTALFAPEKTRWGLNALYAFNLEIARIPEVTTEPLIGKIRLEWWREAIAGIYEGAPRQHAVVVCLAEAVHSHGLTRAHFDRLLNARALDQERRQPASLEELNVYAEATSSGLVWLALEILGVGKNEAATKAAREIGIAWALTGLLRAVPFHGRRDRTYLPDDLMKAGSVSTHQLRSMQSTSGLENIVKTIAEEARANLCIARYVRSEVPKAAVPALLLGALADGHLSVLAKTGYNLFDPRVQRPQLFREARLWLRARAGSY